MELDENKVVAANQKTIKFNVKDEDMNKSGIYRIKNLLDGKVYVGSVGKINGFYGRYRQHKSDLGLGNHPNSYLQAAINKHELENFEFSILELVEDDDKLIECEQRFIDLYILDGKIDKNKCYNIRIKAESNRGIKLSDETRERMSASHTGKILSDETKRKISMAQSGENSPNYGKTASPETKMKLSIARSGENNPNFGKSPSDETRQKMIEIKSGENNPMFGHHHSEKTKEKMSEKMLGENNPSSKKVYQFDLAGNLIEIFCSIKEAVSKTGIERRLIIKCCSHKRKIMQNFIFLFEDDKDNILEFI